MEDFIQFSAKTKSEAITKACIELGVSSDLFLKKRKLRKL